MRPLHPVLAHPSLRDALLKLAGLGLVGLAAGLATAPDRAWANLLLGGLYALSLSLGALVFLAVQELTGSRWARAFQRVPEALASAVWVGMVLVAAAVGLGGESLYGWVHDGPHAAHSQAFWLSRPFQLARLAVYAAVWLGLGGGVERRARQARLHATPESPGAAAAFLAAFALTFTAASMDWAMTLEPRWYSTIFGIYLFAGSFLGGLAAIAVMLSLVRRMDALAGKFDEAAYHDLGKLLFGFACFWAYIAYCQYLLIWYTNFPEETVFYLKRTHGPWSVLSGLAVALNWVVPFFALLAASVKKSPKALFRVGACVLVGRWLDLYVVVMPRFVPAGPELLPWELGVFVGSLALLGWAVAGTWEASLDVPAADGREAPQPALR